MSKGSLRGKAVVVQSGGCTAVINQSLAGITDGACAAREITDVWGSRYGIAGILQENLVDLRREKPRLARAIRNLPSAALGSHRHQLREGEEYQILERLRRWNVRYLFMIGGNDTALTGLRIARAADKNAYPLRILHVPKTIDNDLAETDHCPGYGSAARFAAIVTQEIGLDSFAMRQVDPVKIIEFMGRNSGWIVAASALLKRGESDPPHLVLYPEVAFDKDRFLRDVDRALTRYGYCVAAISETIRDAEGTRVGAREEGILQDAFGHPYVEGAAHRLALCVENELKVRSRFDKPGTIQRMSIPYVSAVDQKEAYQAGREAVRLARLGMTRVMVSLVRRRGANYGIELKPVALERVAGHERRLPADYRNGHGIAEEFRRYALPLIGKPLPKFIKLRNVVPKL